MTIPRTDQACGSLRQCPQQAGDTVQMDLELEKCFFLGEGKTITCIADVI